MNYGIYADVLAEAIHLMKFSKLRRLANALGSLFFELSIPRYDGIVPVPLSANSLKARGFNQSLLISRVLSKKLRIPIYIDMLFKTRETLPQIGLNAKERIKNLRGSFEAKKINGLRLLLVDDVMTTGATARECSKVLVKAGAEDVIVVTLARPSRM
ncbi:MAG: ComF family protein [Nitrospiraceae bacterium]|nr:ComF family protein [Nitrospiraceae bacterium]